MITAAVTNIHIHEVQQNSSLDEYLAESDCCIKARIVFKHQVLLIFKDSSLQSNITDITASEKSSMN